MSLEPKDIENPIAESDFRHQLQKEKKQKQLAKLIVKFETVMERHSYYLGKDADPFCLFSYKPHLRRTVARLNKIEEQIKLLENETKHNRSCKRN